MNTTRRLYGDILANKRLVPIVLASIVVLSLLLRVYSLGSESVWFDEGASVHDSRESVSDIVSTLDKGPYYVTYYIILHFWMKLFGESEFSIRFPSVIFGILSVYMIFTFGKLVFNTNVGILSSFVLSISLYHIRYSQEARSYSLLVLFVLLSNYYLVKMLDNKKKKYIIGYIVSSIFMIYMHGYGIFYLISQNIYFLIFKRKDVILWIMIQCTILSSLVLWLSHISRRVDGPVEKNIMSYVLKIPTFDSIYSTFKIFVGSEQILYIFVITILIGLIIDLRIKEYYRDNIRKYAFVILWILVPFIMSTLVSYAMEPLYHNRYFIAILPALILLFSKCISNIKRIPVILTILLIIVVLQIPIMNSYYRDTQKDQWRNAANYVEHYKNDNDKILLYPEFTTMPFGYYYKKDSNYVGINSSFDINRTIANGNRIWLITSHMQYKERREDLELIEERLYSSMYTNEDVVKFYGIRIYLYDNVKKR